MDLTKLKEPFPSNCIEWKPEQTGVTKDGKPWAIVLAYIKARAAQERLDSVCGIENWKTSYQMTDKGFLCTLSIKIGSEWVDKSDGSEFTDYEPFKGGISGAFKRAASIWSIGRYLYDLEPKFAQFMHANGKLVQKDEFGAHKIKIKGSDGGIAFTGYWLPPELPTWALPKDTTPKINFGKYTGMTLAEVPVEKLKSYFRELKTYIEKEPNVPEDGKTLFNNIKEYLHVQ